MSQTSNNSSNNVQPNNPNADHTADNTASGSTHTEKHTEKHVNHKPTVKHADENHWRTRFEELLNVKNVEDLKSELSLIASDIQKEIQHFDINSHLSPEAKTRLKTLEQRYAEVMRSIHKAQKQFDREFNKSLRVLKRTRQDAQKQIKSIKAKITKHRGTIMKATDSIKKKITATTKRKPKFKGTKKTARKSTTKNH